VLVLVPIPEGLKLRLRIDCCKMHREAYFVLSRFRMLDRRFLRSIQVDDKPQGSGASIKSEVENWSGQKGVTASVTPLKVDGHQTYQYIKGNWEES
jgi:hypothetical protein